MTDINYKGNGRGGFYAKTNKDHLTIKHIKLFIIIFIIYIYIYDTERCVFLVYSFSNTVAMTIHHIFDCNIIEGQTEMDNSESDSGLLVKFDIPNDVGKLEDEIEKLNDIIKDEVIKIKEEEKNSGGKKEIIKK